MEKSSAEGAWNDQRLPGLLVPTPGTGQGGEGWGLGASTRRTSACWGKAAASSRLSSPGASTGGCAGTWWPGHPGLFVRGKVPYTGQREISGRNKGCGDAVLGDGVQGDKEVGDHSCLMKEAASELRPAGQEGASQGLPGTGDRESNGPGWGEAQCVLRSSEKALSRRRGSGRWTGAGTVGGSRKETGLGPRAGRKPQRVKQGTFMLITFVFSLKDRSGCPWKPLSAQWVRRAGRLGV